MLPCTALIAKITVEMSTRRITAAVSACSAGSKPGAIRMRTSQGEKMAASAASAPVISTTQLVDGAGQAPGGGPVVRCYKTGKDRDEGRGQRAARDDAEQQIGQLERRVVGVQLRADAERLRDDHVAQQPHRGREGERRGDQQHVARDVAANGDGVSHAAARPARLGRRRSSG